MPEHSTVTSASATQDDAHYSPRLTNDDLAPVRQQTWSWYNIFSFWMSDVHKIGRAHV